MGWNMKWILADLSRDLLEPADVILIKKQIYIFLQKWSFFLEKDMSYLDIFLNIGSNCNSPTVGVVKGSENHENRDWIISIICLR